MSKFHNYSFNNTLLIAMQKPDASLIAGFNAWKNNFGRNVMRGEKGIRILAPSPYKIRQEVEKKDPQTGKTVIGKTKPGKKPEKKPSIRAQLRADKERAAQKKQARNKSQDLERS